jgi:uncharacterized protein (DUF433 family)
LSRPTIRMYFLLIKGMQKTLNLNKLNKIKRLLERITIDPGICHGKPCIRGMRWPVEVIIDMLGSGMSTEEIIVDHPELEKEDILASLNFANLYLRGQSIKDVA